jgi:hypothetical protein
MTRLFEARYDGRCDANGCRIEAGDMIGYADGYDKPLCKHCWREEMKPPDPICPDCFTIHAGECL